jgi:heat shock protein HslJ
VLRAWDLREASPAEVEVTLTYAEGRFAGKSGCNRYTGAAKSGDAPGELAVGPTAGTRMACPEPQSSVETRFLKQLSTAKKFGFFVGQLAISYDTDAGTPGTMLFSARASK